MSESPLVVIHPDKQLLAGATAARLLTAILDAQAARGEVDIVLTGGSMGSAILAPLADRPGREAVDWAAVNVWWGDERFLPAGDPDRNETQAREALLDHVPLDPDRVHPMPGPDGPEGDSVEAAAERYAATLAEHAGPGLDVPRFDVVILGVGPDAHCASLFPNHPALDVQDRSVVAVRDSPKPPPTRISMTFPTLRAGLAVWFVVAGDDKAGAVGLALSDTAVARAPAGAVSGIRSTTWLLDREAAAQVPPDLLRPSPS